MTVAVAAGRAAAGRAAAQGGAASATAGATAKPAAKAAAKPRKSAAKGKPRPRKASSKPAPQEDLVAAGKSTNGQPFDYSAEKNPEPKPEPKEEGETGGESSKPAPESRSGGFSIPLPQSGTSKDASWAILAFLAWGWVIMPFLENGLPGMKKVLLAKFFNKKPDGSFYE
jgi:hypothetical protein